VALLVRMEHIYELVVHGDEERVVTTEEPLDVGDALIVEDEVLLVLRECRQTAAARPARCECRRALQLSTGQELLTYTRELELKFAEAREVRRSLTNR
jgi:hypothetical protein